MGAVAVIVSIAVLGVAGAAAAQTPPEASEQSPVIEDKNKVVCRSVRTTSTRMPARICEAKGQKEERLKKARDRQVKMDTNGAEPYGAARNRDGLP